MTGAVFFKMSGSGNDFVFLDGRWTSPDEWPTERIRRICARGTGVGADGLVILVPGSGPGVVRFHYYNSDGSRGAMCGNAALCATRLAALLELAPPDAVVLDTDAGPVRSRCVPESAVRAELALPDVAEVRTPGIAPMAGERRFGFTLVGVPHLVVLVDDLEGVDLVVRGRDLRSHGELGAEGANVNFVSRANGVWAMRTYERGVEAETLACGTGAVACATLLSEWRIAELPLTLATRSGSQLSVSGIQRLGGGVSSPMLGGDARLVFRVALGPDL